MRTRRLLASVLTVGTLVGLSIVAAGPAQADPLGGDISNGSFETPALPPGSAQAFGAGASIGAWKVNPGGSVDIMTAGFWQAADGNQSLDLNGDSPGGISQTVGTLPLLSYRISFKLAGNPVGGPTVKTGQVLVNGHVVKSFSFDTTGKSTTNMGYVGKEAVFFSGLGGPATVQFKTTTPDTFGPVIDNVEVLSCLLVICVG
jgi:choice-of-anchor C domain-containing protein